MNLNSAALLLMAAKGLSLEDVAEIVRANEVTRDPTAAERQARCRARKRSKSQRDVTRDPPNDNILTPGLTPTPNGVDPQPVTKTRGSRLATDWTLPDEWRQWARDRRNWSGKDVSEEAEIFANYWQAKSGAGACHTDWFKTWRNWVIRSHRADGKGDGKVSKAQQIENLRRSIEFYDRTGKRDEAQEARRKIALLEAA